MFAVVLVGWVGGRIAFWEGPVDDLQAVVLASDTHAFAHTDKPARPNKSSESRNSLGIISLPDPGRINTARNLQPDNKRARRPQFAVRQPPNINDTKPPIALQPTPSGNISPPVAAPSTNTEQASPAVWSGASASDRWSVDAWGFWRQGSDAAPISQGRVPIYGASQVGAIAQFRPDLGMPGDVRIFARGYRALVNRGEAEISLGVSARPARSVPLRAYAEMRYTDAPFSTQWRPAAFIVTELPRQNLPGRIQLEAYGQAGWVGGKFATPFADGQMTLAREVASFAGSATAPVRLSVGGGAWGGAQRDADRVDIGPHMRLEWQMGSVPARLSVDWRERISGDAAPESGLAATLSTSF